MGSSLDSKSSEEINIDALMAYLGEDFNEAFSDPETIEIMLNPDGVLWSERHGEHMKKIGFIDVYRARSALSIIAANLGAELIASNSIIEGSFPLEKSRISIQIPPSTDAPAFTLRKRASKVFPLNIYVEEGIMTQAQREIIRQFVLDKQNIIVVGGPGSGKTTLTNGIIHEAVSLFPYHRFIIIEDVPEIQCSAENTISLYTSQFCDHEKLVKATLRMRPDRVLIGEVRDSAALDLLDSWNTGQQGGVATVHANDAFLGIDRLRDLVSRHKARPAEIDAVIGRTVNCIVGISKNNEGNRKVNEIIRINGYEDSKILYEQVG